MEPITASLLMLLTFAWCVLLFVLYKLFDGMRMGLFHNYATDLHEEEMLILMGAMENAIEHEDEPPPQAQRATPGVPASVFPTLRVRNDLWVNIYMVASGVFFAVCPLACLDHYSMVLFMCSMVIISVRDMLLRNSKTPYCKQATATARIHAVVQVGRFSCPFRARCRRPV